MTAEERASAERRANALLDGLIRDAVLEEREACAKVAESYQKGMVGTAQAAGYWIAAKEAIATAIRERK